MGISLDSLKFLLDAQHYGVVFTRTMTIGHQSLRIDEGTVAKALRAFSGKRAEEASAEMNWSANPYADKLLGVLGAETLDSIDYADYEAATVVHDMNTPIFQELACSYDLVLDGGSLEHIFNFPVAIRNCMEMVKIGGHLIIQTP